MRHLYMSRHVCIRWNEMEYPRVDRKVVWDGSSIKRVQELPRLTEVLRIFGDASKDYENEEQDTYGRLRSIDPGSWERIKKWIYVIGLLNIANWCSYR